MCLVTQSCLILCNPLDCNHGLSMGFLRQEYWSRLPFHFPGDLPDSGIEPTCPAFSSVQFSHSVVSDSLRPHESQHARPPCPALAPRVHPNPCPSSRWCHPTISSSVIPFSSCPQSFPALGSFPTKSALRIRWPKYWSFSFNISPSNEQPGLVSFRMDWLDLLAV